MSASHSSTLFAQLNICVVMPTYRNAQFLDEVIGSVLEVTDNLIVVNDGSPDNTAEVLSRYQDRITVVTHQQNKGKGNALITGFKTAKQKGFRYAITMDSDNQHKASDLHLFAEEIERHPDSIIVGARSLAGKDIKQSSSFANKFSNFWFAVHTLHRLKDTQTGFRLYTVDKIAGMYIFSSKYEAELEMLVRSVWKGVEVRSVDINVFYPPKNERVSSFRPYRDFTRISILNTIFTFVALFYGYPSMLVHYIAKKFKCRCL